MTHRFKSFLILFLIYLVAFGLAFWAATASSYSILVKSAIMVMLAVMIIYMGSLDFNNSSVFDPYWSVAPPLMVVFYLSVNASAIFQPAPESWGYMPRLITMFLLILTYSIRLTGNFLRGWPGLKHEDWRYMNFRKKTGKAYWVVSLLGIHLFPAIMVFGGTLSIWVVVVQGSSPLNFLDILAVLVTGFAILLEGVSDNQMRRFLKTDGGSGKTMDKGLWALSRHPNYLGEICFWWGIYLFALAANSAFWWVIIGPVAITLMFVFVSIPMIERRMVERRSDYPQYQKKISMLIPWKL